MHFESPWAFLLLLAIPAVLFLRRATRKNGGIRFSSIAHAAQSGRSLRQRLAVLPLVLRVIALVCLIIALARPQTGREQIRDISHGIAIEMAVDRSGSMGTEMEYHGTRMSRLDAVKKVFLDFALGNGGDLPGRPDDLIGIVDFARYPDTICPLTLAHGALPLFIKDIRLAHGATDGTAIGDGLALAAARLKTAETTLSEEQQKKHTAYKIKSKIIILLSDGQNNCGRRTPLAAAALAKKWGIKVYTIAIGGGSGMTTIQTPFGAYQVPMGQGVDTATLKAIADKTGGAFFSADNADSLDTIYKKIDRLEKSKIESVRYIDYKEDFLPFALAGLLLLAAEILLSCTLFRRVP